MPADRPGPDMIPLPLRASTCLADAGVATTADLCGRTADELLEIPGIGPTTVHDIREALLALGLSLRGDDETYLPAREGLDRGLAELESAGSLAIRAGERERVLNWLTRSALGGRGD